VGHVGLEPEPETLPLYRPDPVHPSAAVKSRWSVPLQRSTGLCLADPSPVPCPATPTRRNARTGRVASQNCCKYPSGAVKTTA
jgi:hypothetical protein